MVSFGSGISPVTAAYEDGMELWIPQKRDFFAPLIEYGILKKDQLTELDNGCLK
jgi:hypothetical protein